MLELMRDELDLVNSVIEDNKPPIIVFNGKRTGGTNRWNANHYIVDYMCLCDKGNGVLQHHDDDSRNSDVLKCKFCGNKQFITRCITDDKSKTDGLWTNSPIKTKKKETLGRIYLVKEHPDDKSGIRILNVAKSAETSRTKSGYKYQANCVVEYYFDFIPGKVNQGYKNLKKGPKEVSVLESLMLSTNTSYLDSKIFYENAWGLIDFMTKHPDFMKRSGLEIALKENKCLMGENTFFLIFLTLMNEYPILEQLLKMGYYSLFNGVVNTVKTSTSRIAIAEEVANLEVLFDKEATSGKKGLRLPSYISDYLRERGSSLKDYIFWADIYDITKISKENFMDLVDSKEYMQLKFLNGMEIIPNILKYGYTMKQVSKYAYEQNIERMRSKDVEYWYGPITLWRDYLQMCETLGLVADRFPQDIKKSHDDMMSLVKEHKSEIENDAIKRVSIRCNATLFKSTRKEETKFQKEYQIVFPNCVNDFVQEGINQRNCVGGYARLVAKGDTIVFFVRKKSEPDKSYITAECRNGKLVQCMYACNVRVNDKEILSALSVVAKQLETARRNAAA